MAIGVKATGQKSFMEAGFGDLGRGIMVALLKQMGTLAKYVREDVPQLFAAWLCLVGGRQCRPLCCSIVYNLRKRC